MSEYRPRNSRIPGRGFPDFVTLAENADKNNIPGGAPTAGKFIMYCGSGMRHATTLTTTHLSKAGSSETATVTSV